MPTFINPSAHPDACRLDTARRAGFTRRIALRWAALAALPALVLPRAKAQAVQAAQEGQQGRNVSQAELLAMKLPPDGITLDFPSLADTGTAIPLDVAIVAPKGTTIEMVEIFLPENPNTRALKLKVVQTREQFEFSTRLRLAGSQDVWVVVTFSSGARHAASAPTVVTSSACFDAS